MKKEFWRFIYEGTLLAFPVLVLVIAYLVFDPFKVVWNYKSFFRSGIPSYVVLNRDYVSTQTFINNSPQHNYSAFIFGNSRSLFYEVATWQKYIHTKDCFHFDAGGESLLGIYRKFKFLKERGLKISKALIVLDNYTLQRVNERGDYLLLSHPALSKHNVLLFQLEFFKTFLSRKFFYAFFDLKLSNSFKEYMSEGSLMNNWPIEYDYLSNELKFTFFERQIESEPSKYYNEKMMRFFYRRDSIQKFSEKVIFEKQYHMLKVIRDILKEDKTDYKIVISPLYDQLRLNVQDVEILQELFGRREVYDFSGINFITKDYRNYYENSHYRPHVADHIMNEIYK